MIMFWIVYVICIFIIRHGICVGIKLNRSDEKWEQGTLTTFAIFSFIPGINMFMAAVFTLAHIIPYYWLKFGIWDVKLFGRSIKSMFRQLFYLDIKKEND